MSSVFEFNFSGSNYKVDKKSNEYKRLKELFPDCDFIFNLKKSPTLMNDGNEYPSVLQFLAKGINEPVGQFIFEKPLDVEVYKLVNKLTDGKWEVEIYIIQTYSGEGTTWNANGKITDKGIDWDISQNEDENEEASGDDENECTSLLDAALWGYIKATERLLHKKSDIEEKDDDGKTALVLAAQGGYKEIVELLIDKGADIEAKDNKGMTALMYAVSNPEIIELLLDKGADIEAQTNKGGTALIVAAANGKLDTVKKLIQAGANLDIKNKEGKTALIRADEEGHTEIIKYLTKGTSSSGTKESLKALKLTIGTIAWEQEREDGTLIVGGKKQKGYAIYENKADYNFIYDLTKKESLQNAATDLVSGDLRHADNMESEGSENKGVCYYNGKGEESDDIDEFVGVGDTEVVNIETPYGYSEVVLELSDSTKIKSIIKKTGIEQDQCFDYFKKEANGAKILKLLSDLCPAWQKSIESAKSNVEEQRKVSAEEELFVAAKEGDIGKVKSLLEKGVNIEAKSKEGHTALLYATLSDNMKTVELLLKKGADIEAIDAEAKYCIGNGYSDGKGVPVNKVEAVKWYKKAADQGYADAQYCLGSAYLNGEGVPKNKKEAVKWYRKAADQGYEFAQCSLGNAYSDGEGVPKDEKEAVKWYRKAADQGHDFAQLMLGYAYYQGKGVPENKKEAAKWFKKAADQEQEDAQYCLGFAYENGEGVPKDNKEALKWYKLAAAQDHEDAQEAVDRLSGGKAKKSKGR